MPELVGFDVWVEVEDMRLAEYGVERDEIAEVKTATCWIPCEAGKEFRLGLRAPGQRSTNYAFLLKVDGEIIHMGKSTLFLKSQPEENEDGETRRYDGLLDYDFLHPFQFASIRMTDDDTHISGVRDGLGDIVVEFATFDKMRTIVQQAEKAPAQASPNQLVPVVVHEKAMKGLTTCVQYGAPRPIPGVVKCPNPAAPQRIVAQFLDFKIIGKITLKYRSQDILVASGVAPRRVLEATPASPAHHAISSERSSTPGSSASDGKKIKLELDEGPDDETDSELQALKAQAEALEELARVKARIAKMEAKKRARKVEGGPDLKRVKTEQDNPAFAPGEVIDLT